MCFKKKMIFFSQSEDVGYCKELILFINESPVSYKTGLYKVFFLNLFLFYYL